MAQKVIRSVYSDGSVVLSNIRNDKGFPIFKENDTITATKVTTWYDGTPMEVGKADGKVYLRYKPTGEFFLVNLPNWGETFLEKDTMQQMRDMSFTEILLLKAGYYKGVTLNGYYAEGDTPAPIEYYLSDTTSNDDGGSVILVGSVKLEHVFYGFADIRYFGGKDEELITNNTQLLNIINHTLLTGASIIVPDWFTLRISLEKGTHFYKYTNNKNINFSGGGLIKDVQSYNTSPLERANFLAFNNCENVNIDVRVEGKMINVNRPTTSVEGQTFFRFENNCKNINLNIHGKGAKTLVEFFAEYDASDLSKLDIKNENIQGNVTAINCRYGVHSAWGSKNLRLNLNTDACGRSYFIIGSDLINLNVNSKNQVSTSLIKSYYGRGVTNCTIVHEDLYSSTSSLANELVAIHYGDETPAIMENINIRMNVSNPSSGWGNTFGIFKYIGGGTTADNTGRGHVLRNFNFSGVMRGRSGTQHLVTNVGQFNSPDVIESVSFKDLKLSGGVSFNFNTNNIGNNVLFENVVSDFNVYSNCETVFKSCEALNFTSSNTSVVKHIYDKCSIKSGNSQNYSFNKIFSNTKVPSGNNRNSELTIGTKYTNKASFRHEGSLIDPISTFKLPYNTQGLFMLKYYLINEVTQSNPANRREVFGIKTFSLFINTTGVVSILSAIDNLVPEKILGVDPAVLSISFANNGQSVDLMCSGTNYSSTLSRMVLELEVMSSGSNFIDII